MKYCAQEGEKREGAYRDREGGREGDRKREGPGEGREGERDYSPVFSSCWNASVAVVVK